MDESYRGFISIDVGEEKLDLVDFERRFGRAALDACLAKAELALVDDAGLVTKLCGLRVKGRSRSSKGRY
jgi:hypothetical protein